MKNKSSNKRATDPIDQLIYEKGLRIKGVYINKELDILIVILNNKKIIKTPISDYKRLKKATQEQLQYFKNDGIGIHWIDLNEDLSLRGFLKYELAHFDKPVVA